MKASPLVSVIIPTYNHGEFVGIAVCSALEQTYKNIEVIVIDNFSTDKTMQVLNQFNDSRLKVLQFKNQGVIASARNFGVSQAQGEVLAFLDSDDRWLPQKIELQLTFLDDTRVCCVSSNFTVIGDTCYHKQHLSFLPRRAYRDYSYAEVALSNPIMTSSALLRAADFRAVGGFDEGREFMYIEDWELWLRMARQGVVRVLSAPLIEYRIFRNKVRDRRNVTIRMLEVLKRQKEMGYLSGRELAAALASCYLTIGRAYLDSDDRAGIGYYRRALLDSVGLRNQARALVGLALFYVPSLLRHLFLEAYYRTPLRRAS